MGQRRDVRYEDSVSLKKTLGAHGRVGPSTELPGRSDDVRIKLSRKVSVDRFRVVAVERVLLRLASVGNEIISYPETSHGGFKRHA